MCSGVIERRPEQPERHGLKVLQDSGETQLVARRKGLATASVRATMRLQACKAHLGSLF